MINASYAWSTVFHPMINSCDTWSTVFHGNDQCLSYMINSLSSNDRCWSCMNCYEWYCSYKNVRFKLYVYSLSLFCSVARRPSASEEGGMVALSQMPTVDHVRICWSSNDKLLIMDAICWSCYDHGDDMLIVAMIGVLIMHDVLKNHVTMKVIVITSLPSEKLFCKYIGG